MWIAERTPRFETWIAPMRRRATLPRILGGMIMAAGLWILGIAVSVTLAEEAGLAPDRGVIVVYLLTFGILIAGAGLAMRLLHHLPGARLLGPEERIERSGVLAGIVFVAVVVAILALPLFLFEPPERQMPVAVWLLWLPAVLPALFVQVTAEEIVFRGYLQGMLAARFASRLLWWVPPALLFGILHWNPEMGENAWLMVAIATVMGLVFGDIAARSGSLAVPIGLHFANNAFAMLIVATPSQLSGLALYLSPVEIDDPAEVRMAMLGNLVLILVLWFGYLLFLRIRGR
jgi:membrane protease YdiL (CAAX protease family)